MSFLTKPALEHETLDKTRQEKSPQGRAPSRTTQALVAPRTLAAFLPHAPPRY